MPSHSSRRDCVDHHKAGLDKLTKTMRDTGRDMQDEYQGTSRAGSAVNVIEC